MQAESNSAARSRGRRRGSLALELVLVLPIVVILILSIVQFGLFHANMQQVALACRVGAEEASQTPNLSTVDGDPVPENVLEAVRKQLESSRIRNCRIRLEHNTGGAQVALISPAGAGCDAAAACKLSDAAIPRSYVRLSVCVPKSAIMPNCLYVFGYDVADPCAVVGCSSVFRYELDR